MFELMASETSGTQLVNFCTKRSSLNNCLGGMKLICFQSAINIINFVKVFLRIHTQFNKSVEDYNNIVLRSTLND